MSEKVYDLIIIGGGISGVGLALEASRKKLKVLILEKSRMLNGASGNSLRIIHGGFRYLQSLSFNRIAGSIKAQSELLNKYPGYIKPLSCLLPLHRTGVKSASPVMIANLLYSALYRFYSNKSSGNKILSSKDAEGAAAVLKGKCPYGALLWNDAVISDLEGFHQALREELLKSGVEISEGSPVKRVGNEKELLFVHCGEREFRARSVVNCAGAWVHSMEIDLPTYSKNQFLWCKAFNLVLKNKIDTSSGIGVESRIPGQGKRFYFLVPRGENTVAGTEYTKLEGSPDSLKISELEIESFVTSLNASMPELGLKTSDVLSVEAGVLPYLNHDSNGYNLLGSEAIFKYGNYFEVLSTKYTTFLNQARSLMKMLPIVK